MTDYVAGGGKKLGIIRYGRERMDQYERQATETIMPGQAVERTTDANGDPAFQRHTGTDAKDVYVAVEARGRGMDAQTTEGYKQGEMVIAVRPAGGGLNLLVSDGENVTDGDPLVVNDATAGEFIVQTTEPVAAITAHAAEDEDLSGATDAGLVKAEAE